jgi:hypothetical protein
MMMDGMSQTCGFSKTLEEAAKQSVSPEQLLFTGLAGAALHDKQLLSAYEQVPRSPTPWVQWVDLVVKQAMA